MEYFGCVDLSVLQGKTLIEITGAESGSKKITFRTRDGDRFQMLHNQDCCESVEVESIVGDISDLLNDPILLAEEVSRKNEPYRAQGSFAESFTWTFYKLATRKGYVDIRWYGQSNGFYSESVDFEKIGA